MSHRSVVIFMILFGTIFVPISSLNKFPRIQGGTDANIADFPWMASIRYLGEHFCGGSIISPKTILTAAHCMCVVNPGEIDVRVGSKHRSSGGQLLAAEGITCHDQFDNKTQDYDIAIIRLGKPIVFSSTAKAVPLAKADFNINVGQYGHIVGWGYTNPHLAEQSEVLQTLPVQIVSNKLCETILGITLTERMVCAGEPKPGKISCSGDSGGSLTIDGVLVGINSQGPPCGRPDAFTKVSALRSWVLDNLKKFNEKIA